ncbi:MAG: hypothetical protein V3575_03920 [Candidatus Absconditabacteria bacterium]
MAELIKSTLKAFLFSVVFFSTGIVFYHFVNGWSGDDLLTAENNDLLTPEKWNGLKSLVDTKYSEVKICTKADWANGFPKGKFYSCEGVAGNNTSGPNDTVIQCPTGYEALSVGYYSSVAPFGAYSNDSNGYVNTSGTLHFIRVVCVK